MAISGTPTGPGPDVVVVEPGGDHRVNGEGGEDLLRVLYQTLATDVDWEAAGFGWQRLADGFTSSVEYVNFERYDIRTGRGDDVVHGGEEADRLSTGAGADGIVTFLGADTVDGGRGRDWAEIDYRSLTDDVDVALHQRRAVTIDATGASLKRIEALRIDTGAGDDAIDTRRVSGDDRVTTRNGDDVFATRSGRDTYDAGDGRDTLIVDYGAETANVRHVAEGFGWTRIEAGPRGPAVSYAGVEAFDLTGGAGHDRLEGRADDDRLVGNGGDDRSSVAAARTPSTAARARTFGWRTSPARAPASWSTSCAGASPAPPASTGSSGSTSPAASRATASSPALAPSTTPSPPARATTR